MSNDGTGEKKKQCPFSGEWCLGDACALSEPMVRIVNGVKVQQSMCSFRAMNTLLSEINIRLQRGQQGKKPGIYLPSN